MGTRALINIRKADAGSEIFTTIYRHMDGYPDGLGNDIKEILGSKELVNGISDYANQVNGMGCAAAMLVWGLKRGECGSIYIHAPGTTDVWEEYVYDLYADDKSIGMSVKGRGGEELYSGRLSDFDAEVGRRA